MLSSAVVLAALVTIALAEPTLVVDRHGASLRFDGLGGLSGGGATSRLLVDYSEPQRGQILDFLFKPNYGASLHILKVEIGGDSQSTDGTETSHMHSANDLNYHRGYEWWLMVEAKKRNPDIKLYGLAWAYPGWVGNGTGSPYSHPDLTANYILKWVSGAKSVYNLTIDFIGIWNERPSNADYVKTLRKTLNSGGFEHVQIVAQDGGAGICTAMQKDPDYADAVSIIGLHYPSDFSDYSTCHSFGKPFWASEESSSYDDLNGAACWARVVNSHWVLAQMTSSIMWNLIGSYYHGTNWYASSMMTAVQPWSGYYEVAPVVWATAHVTQFTQVGWVYLKNGTGSGELPRGGYYATWVDPKGTDFTINVVKISREHAPCTRPGLPNFDVYDEEVTFSLAESMGKVESLAVWYSNFEQGPMSPLFEKQSDVKVVNGQFSLHVPVGGFFTVSTIRTASKGSQSDIPTSSPSFPLPYSDNFDEYVDSSEAHYFADQIGSFEIHPATIDQSAHKNIMRQMVPSLPIGWSDHGSNGPVTVIGMREWADLTVGADFALPADAPSSASGCIATRSDQMWRNGIVVCVSADSKWELTYGGPGLSKSNGRLGNTVVSSGATPVPVKVGTWYTLTLTTINSTASATLDGKALFTNTQIRNLDTGFATIGTNGWFAIEFDNFVVKQAGNDWDPKSPCASAKAGDVLSARSCPTNGLPTVDTQFDLLSNWMLRHVQSGLCATAKSAEASSEVMLEECDPKNALQQFVNDYTNIRNGMRSMTLVNTTSVLAGSTDGKISIATGSSQNLWKSWVYFPNTNQLRNQYTANTGLGYPMCLTTCS